MSEKFLKDRVELHCGDCLEILPTLADNSIDSCVTDPPYHLTSIVKRFGSPTAKPVRVGDINATNDLKAAHARAAAGFMGKQWDGGDISFRPEVWAEVYRVLKPGAHLLAFGGTRTYHRMACAIEDAGFEIRDTIMWLYGSGFPKSHNIGNGWGTALKPACEPIVLARKPLSEGTVAANVLKHGTGALNIDGCRVGAEVRPHIVSDRRLEHNTYGLGLGGSRANGDTTLGRVANISKTSAIYGGGKGLGQGGSRANGDTTLGRWPANLIHDGSEEVVKGFPDVGKSAGGRVANISKTSAIYGGGKGLGQDLSPDDVRGDPGFGDSGAAARFFYTAKADSDDKRKFSGKRAMRDNPIYGKPNTTRNAPDSYGDDGTAARFFYTAKANANDRIGSKHPTVKPLDLMQYLVRLITPKGGIVLDPFAGTGTTGEAAWREGMKAVLIERESEYQADIRRRMELVLSGPDERTREGVKQRTKDKPRDEGPLFSWS